MLGKETKTITPDLETESQPKTPGQEIYEILKDRGLLEILNDPEKKEKFFQKIPFKTFERLLIQINGILRQKTIEERKIDGDFVTIGNENWIGYVPPSPKIKGDLLKLGFESLKDIRKEDRGLLIHYLIQAIHPFLDGNGRTGRFLYHLISEDNLDEQKICNLVDHKSPSDRSEKGNRNSLYKFTDINNKIAQKSLEDMQVLDQEFIDNNSIFDDNVISRKIKLENFDEKSTRDYLFQNAINEESRNSECIAVLIKLKPEYEIYATLENNKYRIDVDNIANALNSEDRNLFLEIHDKYKTNAIYNLY